MTDASYEVLATGLGSAAEAPRGSNVFYRCDACEGVIPSTPSVNVGCDCGKVFIDKDYMRLVVENLTKFTVLRRIGNSGATGQ